MRFHLLCVIWLLSCMPGQWLLAQSGSIRGKVIDEGTGENIVGATVLINSLKVNAITDIDGNFIFPSVPKGMYDVECFYLGYGNQKVVGAKVEEDGVKLVYFKLVAGDAQELGVNVVVTAEASEYLETALLGKRKNSLKFLEALSSEEILRMGDETVAESAKRLASVTVERDQYLYVRGLGGRYVKTWVNGAEIAQFDLSYANIGLDLYPSSILENIIVYKNFSADMSGSFAGGALSINTKSFPDKFNLQVDFSTEYHSLTTFRPTFIGFNANPFTALFKKDIGVPVSADALAPVSGAPNSASTAAEYGEYSRAFSGGYGYDAQSAIPNLNGSFSVGTQLRMGRKKTGTLGMSIVGLLANGYQMYEDGTAARYRIDPFTGTMDTLLHLRDNSYQHTAQWTLMGTWAFKMSPLHKIIFTAARTQRGVATARQQDGTYPELRHDWAYHNRSWQLDVRRQASTQLSGRHLFGKDARNSVYWFLGLANSLIRQPDLRYFSYASQVDSSGYRHYFVADTIGQAPSHYFRHAEEWVIPVSADVQITLPLGVLKTGFAFETHFHTFTEDRFFYATDGISFNGNTADFTDEGNLVRWDEHNQRAVGTYIYDTSLPEHQYRGLELVGGVYALWDAQWNERFKTSIGLRGEYISNDIKTEEATGNGETKESKWIHVQYPAILPSLALSYELRQDMFLRFSYGRTTVRPSFREYIGFVSFDYIGDYKIVGFKDLQASPVNNIDLRWEWYMGLREMIAVGAFFKHFDKPIERVLDPQAQFITFRNAPRSFLAGAELEIRQDLGFAGEWGNKWYLTANAAYIYSITEIPSAELTQILAANSQARTTRPLFGQSPFVLNFGLHYRDDERGTLASLAFNMAGKRLIYEFADGTPDIYELPKPTLDFNFSQQVGKYLRLRFSARNLLNAQQQESHELNGEHFYYRRYALGQSFLFGLSFVVK